MKLSVAGVPDNMTSVRYTLNVIKGLCVTSVIIVSVLSSLYNDEDRHQQLDL